MSCPRTEHLLINYFDDKLPETQKQEMDSHIQACQFCQQELQQVIAIEQRMQQWEDVDVPRWNRKAAFADFKEDDERQEKPSLWNIWQWLPTASSLAMLVILLFNTSITTAEDGFSIAFGNSAGSAENAQNDAELQAQLAAQLESFRNEQQQQLNTLVARIEDRQDENNLRLMQAMMEQSQVSTDATINQMFSYFEQQRELDLQVYETGYQQLADSDYQTIQSLRQLASHVSFQGTVQ